MISHQIKPMTELIKIGVSSCLLGNKVRYNGGHENDFSPNKTNDGIDQDRRQLMPSGNTKSAITAAMPATAMSPLLWLNTCPLSRFVRK